MSDDHLTLDEIKARDVDNWRSLDLRRFMDPLASHLAYVQGQILRETFKHITGFDIERAKGKILAPRKLEKLMKKHNVKIETRHYKEPEDQERSGTYLYKDGEIVLFLGQIGFNQIAGEYEFWSNGSF